MRKRLLSVVSAAAVLAGSVLGISATDAEAKSVALSPRASIEITDGQVRGITGLITSDFLRDQFEGEVIIADFNGAIVADGKNVPSDSCVVAGEDVIAHVTIPGDATRDGKINLADASAMLKSIAKWTIGISTSASDLDGNSKVNLGDVSVLLKYIAKWDVKIFDETPMISVFTAGETDYKLYTDDEGVAEKVQSGIKALTGNEIALADEITDDGKYIVIGKYLYDKYDFIDEDAAKEVESTRAYIDTYGGNIYLSANTYDGILGCINYITTQAFTPELDMNIPKGTACELGDLETLIRPLYTTVEIDGLTESHRLLHITDSHLTTIYDDEETPERRANVMSRLNDWMIYQYRKPSYLYFNEYFRYAENISAEAIMLTGDITDSPSQSNRDILEAAIDNCTVPSYYMYGNHDWSWNTNEATGDLYHSETFRHAYRESFEKVADKDDPDWSDYYSVIDKGEYMIVEIDNAWQGFPNFRPAYNGIKAAFDTAKAENKPVILMLHVPIHVQEMHDSVPHITGNGYCVTAESGNTLIYNMITAEDSPVKAIFAGHIHANYESMIGNIPQYTTGAALEGYCRVVDLVPAK